MEIKENICINGLCDNRTEGPQLVCDECLEKTKEDFSEKFNGETEVRELEYRGPLEPRLEQDYR